MAPSKGEHRPKDAPVAAPPGVVAERHEVAAVAGGAAGGRRRRRQRQAVRHILVVPAIKRSRRSLMTTAPQQRLRLRVTQRSGGCLQEDRQQVLKRTDLWTLWKAAGSREARAGVAHVCFLRQLCRTAEGGAAHDRVQDNKSSWAEFAPADDGVVHEGVHLGGHVVGSAVALLQRPR